MAFRPLKDNLLHIERIPVASLSELIGNRK